MSLRDCLVSAVDQGAISREEASALLDEFDDRFAQLRASMGDAPAKAKARQELEAALRATALEARRRADLAEAARLRLKGELQSYRNVDDEPDVFEAAIGVLSHYGFRQGSSVRGRFESIVTMAHGKLEDLMWAYRRSAGLGTRKTKILDGDLVKELRGEVTNNPDAKGFAGALSNVLEDLRLRFNAAGGAIAKLENWGLPQRHDTPTIRALSADPAQRRALWKDRIAPLLDPDRMINPLTKQPVGRAGLDRALDHVFDTVISEDWANHVPSMIPNGRGALATQRQDHRFLVFKDADSWLAYQREFGGGDVAQVIFDHINGMARDIAAMEILGPNPGAMVEWLKQVTRHEIGQMEAGNPSLASRGRIQRLIGPAAARMGKTADLDLSLGRYAEHRLDALWMDLRGRPRVVSGLANRMDDFRNVAGAAVLGKTVFLAAATDPFIAAGARRLAALPQTGLIADAMKALPRQNRRDLIRSGIIWSDFMHVMQDEVRFMEAGGAPWSRWLLDRTVTLSGLSPLTDARRVVEARAWQAHLADEAGKRFDQLDTRLRDAMRGFGVDAADWDIMRQSVDPNGFVTPMEIARRGGAVSYLDLKNPPSPADAAAEIKALAHRRAAEKLAEIQSSWNERAVPSGSPNARSLVVGQTERGTFTGELMWLFTQLKSFPLSFTSLQIEALGRAAATDPSGRAWGGTKYFAMMAIPMTLGAAVYLQISALLDGKDPEDITDPAFLAKASIIGGGFGVLGDFAQASDNRFGGSMLESLVGPGAGLISDTAALTVGNAMQAARGEDTKLGREAVKYLGRWTPVISSHWATRAAYRRVILDQLQHMVDPDADKSFKAQQSQMKRRTGQEYFWRPGQTRPDRAPRLP